MFLTFGEVMARIAPAGNRRWRQTLPGSVQVTWGGGEANVAASLALYGEPVRYITALPQQPVAQTLVDTLRGIGVDTSQIIWRDGRLGLYFVEVGANQRGSTVIYDRAGSAISLAEPDEFDWDSTLADIHWLHLTGITPAISRQAFETNLAIARAAKSKGITVSCDLNYRKKLWKWEPATEPNALAQRCMRETLPFVDLVIGNEGDAHDVLGIQAGDTNVEHGQLNVNAYRQVAEEIVGQFANVSRVAITLRESISANHNNWGAMLYTAHDQQAHFAPLAEDGTYHPYQIRNIVDRVGAGDSFAAGLLYALNSDQFQAPSQAIAFAVAASCLKHSIQGDFNYVTLDEVVSLMGGNATGRVQR